MVNGPVNTCSKTEGRGLKPHCEQVLSTLKFTVSGQCKLVSSDGIYSPDCFSLTSFPVRGEPGNEPGSWFMFWNEH